jgi:hypothetical protein
MLVQEAGAIVIAIRMWGCGFSRYGGCTQVEQRELAKTIRVSGSILLSTVSNFLDFFKMEAGKQLDIVRTEMDLQVRPMPHLPPPPLHATPLPPSTSSYPLGLLDSLFLLTSLIRNSWYSAGGFRKKPLILRRSLTLDPWVFRSPSLFRRFPFLFASSSRSLIFLKPPTFQARQSSESTFFSYSLILQKTLIPTFWSSWREFRKDSFLLPQSSQARQSSPSSPVILLNRGNALYLNYVPVKIL